MSVQVIDGTLDSIEVGREAKGIAIFKSASFTTVDGKTKTLPKFVAPTSLKGELLPGTRARFYHYKSIDHQGIVGVRTPDGRATFHFPRNNEWIALGVVLVNIAWLTLMILAEDKIPFLAVGLIILGAFLWFISRNARTKAQALFNAG
jgi:hypothetical protein